LLIEFWIALVPSINFFASYCHGERNAIGLADAAASSAYPVNSTSSQVA
jgi:hypothetical protein